MCIYPVYRQLLVHSLPEVQDGVAMVDLPQHVHPQHQPHLPHRPHTQVPRIPGQPVQVRLYIIYIQNI